MPCPDPAPAACRLSGVERAAASAEETDIDAVELPLPGADILDFSRGVTDLDAVGKEVGGHTEPRVPALCSQGVARPQPRDSDVHPEGPGVGRDCAAFPSSRIKAICRCSAALWLGAQGTPGERWAEAQLCAATRKTFGAELIGIFFPPKTQK